MKNNITSATFLNLNMFCLKKIDVPTTVSFNKLQNSPKNEKELIKNEQLKSVIKFANSDSGL